MLGSGQRHFGICLAQQGKSTVQVIAGANEICLLRIYAILACAILIHSEFPPESTIIMQKQLMAVYQSYTHSRHTPVRQRRQKESTRQSSRSTTYKVLMRATKGSFLGAVLKGKRLKLVQFFAGQTVRSFAFWLAAHWEAVSRDCIKAWMIFSEKKDSESTRSYIFCFPLLDKRVFTK